MAMTDLELMTTLLHKVGLKPEHYEELSELAFEVAYSGGDNEWKEHFPESIHDIPQDFKVLVSPLIIKEYYEKFELECVAYAFFTEGNGDNPFAFIIVDEMGLTIKFDYLYGELELPKKKDDSNGAFINFRDGSPDLTFNTDCKRLIKEWDKNYLKIELDRDNGNIIFQCTDDEIGAFRVYSKSSWIKGVFHFGLTSVRIRNMFNSEGINHQRLYVEVDDDNQRFIFKYK
jgi:hypothetical protein